ncbi:MAG: M14 family metallopeptidase [Lacrimispora sp.]|uniref:M14 family metallopeptidase n=1 Tax=Lacrimispora sp. TaxID=2719234 RepID=UPI0039E464C8
MSLHIGNCQAKAGQKQNGMLEVGEGDPKLPMTLICGKEDGPTVLISAGIHGAEYIGIQTAMELSREIEPEDVKGNLIFLLIANPSACRDFVRFAVPEDGKNLNRMFPGKEDGSLSERIAYTVVKELYSKADYFLDIHAGDTSERVMPFLYFPGGAKEDVVEASKNMAKAADMAVRARSGSLTGACGCAGAHGIPSLLLERGGGGVFTREEVELYKRDIRNILIRLKVLEGEEVHTVSQSEVNTASYIEAEMDGFWYPALNAGDRFPSGALLGEVKDVWGELKKAYYGEYDGIILYQTVGMGIKKGDPLVAYGMVEEGE